jgi:hypothetical protein
MNDINKLKKKMQLSKKMLDEIGGWEHSTPGTALVHRFCNAVSEGNVPSQDDLKMLANALEPLRHVVISDKNKTDNFLRDGLDEFARRLQLKRKQGRRKSGLKEWGTRVDAVKEYLEKKEALISEGSEEKKADSQAIKAITEKYKIGEKSAKNWIKQHLQVAEFDMAFEREAKAIAEELKTGKF